MAGMVVKLYATKGPEQGNTFDVPAGETRIFGRSSKADVTIRDMGISRIHCQLTNDSKRAQLEDLNSKNGTVVNGERIIQSTQLHDEDVVKIGTSVFLVTVEGAPTGSAAAIPEPRPASSETNDLGTPVGVVEPPPETPQRPLPGEAEEPPLRREEVDSSADAGSLMGAFDKWLQEESEKAELPDTDSSDERIDAILKNVHERDASAPAEPEAAQAEGGEEAAEPAEEAEGGAEESIPVAEAAEPPTTIEPGDEDTAEPEPTEDPRIGQAIAGCRIEERLESDELSVIYRAVQVSMDRPVELRLLNKELTRDEEAVQRFISAARACGRLTHPHILQVYDAGEENGIYYIALEHIEGKSVHQYLVQAGSGKPLPVETTLEVGVQIAGALVHAHAQGIYHGSIDLDNILVTRHGISKLAEVGFSKGLQDAGVREGADGGRPVTQFTAPEQLQYPPVVEPRTDLYALGVVLFVMLSGHLPFNAETEEELETKIGNGVHESLLGLRSTLPAELGGAVDKAMAADPDHRYRDAAEFQRELTDIRDRLR